jgi:hypothetical protein
MNEIENETHPRFRERRQHEAADASQGPESGLRCSKPTSTVTNHTQTTGEIATLGTRSLFEAMQMWVSRNVHIDT